MMNIMGFRSKLLITILPVLLVGVLAIAASGYYSASSIIMNTQVDDLTLLTQQICNEMTEWMGNCRQDAGLLSRLHDIRRACLGGDQADAQSVLDQYQENMPYYEALWLADPEGNIVMDSIGGQAIGLEVGAMPGFKKNIAGRGKTGWF